MPAISTVAPSGIPYVDYVDSGTKWATNSLTYSFPASASFYIGANGAAYGSGEENVGFKAFTAVQQAATTSILNMYSAVANLTFTQIAETSTQSADLRYAESNLPITAWGYYPTSSPEGGDAWFNNSTGMYNNPVVGNYAWLTIMHETGHLVGLKHPQDVTGSFGATPANVDSLEYSVMSYRSYTGASTTQGLTNATWSFPTTLMMYDIAALQYMYGANYSTNSGDTVYKWSPSTGQEFINGVAQAAPGGNTIFMTVWDGGGNDTYDFSNYTTNLSINLQPGAWTTTSTAQLANLGAGHTAIGNIANAYLYNNNPASLIENAVGGSGNDTIIGNAANNVLTGGAGNDYLDGVSGTNTAVYSGPSTAYQVTKNSDGTWTVVDLRAGSPDGTDTLKNIELLQFSDKTVAIGTVTPPPAIAAPSIASISPDSSVGDDITNANVLTLAGVAQANATVKVYDGATFLGSATANGSGAWSFATSTLTDGDHSFTAIAADSSGNTSAASSVMNVIVDTVAPVAPTVGLQSADSGIVGDHITNVNVVSLTGSAEINSTIKVYDNGTLLGSATANAEGVWNFVANLGDDQIAVPTSTASITSAVFGNASTVVLTGTADANSIVSIYNSASGALVGTATAGSDGQWNYTGTTNAQWFKVTDSAVTGSVAASNESADASGENTTQAWAFTTAPMPDGTHNFTVTSTDLAGNTGTATAFAVTIDTTAPNAPVITGDTVVNSNEVMLIGTAEANSTVAIFEGSKQLGTAVTNANGAWSYTTGALSNGVHVLTATATDIAGNTSVISQAIDPTIGTVGTIESFGSTSLVSVGKNYFLYNSAGAGPELKYQGAPVVAGQFSSWTPIGAEQTATGYEVAWKVAGANQYTVWTTDSSGNYLSNIGTVSGTSAALESLEASFHQDLNGDGVIGIPPTTTTVPTTGVLSPTVIESFGSTSLAQAGNNFFLDNSAGAGPELKYGGAAVAAGQFPGWTPIGAEQTATGYEVAWHVAGTNNYTVWNTDSSGNYLSNIGTVSGTSTTLETLEASFHQDLNGDGVIGVPTTSVLSTSVIESYGSTSLVQVGNNFFLDNSAGSGPELMYRGAAVVAGQFSNWTPIGVEQTATGYEVAWKVAGANQYTVWTTDSSGNYLSSIGTVSGSNSTLQSLEASFHQDLNGDGVIGIPKSSTVPATTIESFGSTSLVAVGNNFFLDNSAGSGPELKYQGAPVVAGQFSGWTPIGAEQTATGYEVAWKIAGANQYTVWTTDSSGNYLSNIGTVSGSNSTLQSLEASFHQDLNGDGVIGPATGANAAPVTIVAGTAGNDTLSNTAANEIFYGNGGNNTFVFSGAIGKDTIADFQANNDTIQISHNVFASAADALAHAAQVGADVTITIDPADSITLHNTVLSHLTGNNFHLV